MSVCVLQVRATDPFGPLTYDASGLGFAVHTALPAQETSASSRGEVRSALRSALASIGPEIVCVNGWGLRGAANVLDWCLETSTSAILLSDSSEHDHRRNPITEKVKSRFVGLTSAALVGGTSHKRYLAKLGMDADRIFLGYDVIDNGHFREGAGKARSNAASERARLGLPPNYFLCVCRFEEKKNLGMVVRSYARYRSRSKRPWPLVIAGDGILRPEIEAEVDQLGLRGSVLLPGAIGYDALPAYYGLAGCFIHASTIEQWGLVVNEAIAAGLPVLVSERCGCAPELVRDGKNGYLFNPGDPDGLAELMARIAENPDLAAEFASAGEAIVAEWGPGRFGEGLAAAVHVARAERRPAPSVLDRVLVRSLARFQ